MPASAGVVSASRLPSFNGGAFSATSIYQAAQIIAQGTPTTPVAGTGNITITDSQFPFPYDYCIKLNNQNISSFTATDWFTNTANRAAFIIVKGNLQFTSSNITFIPPVQKLMTVILVTGNIVCSATTFSMTARGGTHPSLAMNGATGGYKVFDQVTDAVVPILNYSGGAGGAGRSSAGDSAGFAGSSGTVGTTLKSGGGGGGGMATATSGALSGAGARGTAFGGGAGGGGRRYSNAASSAIDAVSYGGKGGDAIGSGPVGGGAGNPGGTGLNGGGTGVTGTGGTLIIYSLDQILSSYSAVAQGSNGGTADTPGGGSGGGNIFILARNSTGAVTLNVNGGTGPSSWGGPQGGAGGAGYQRALAVTIW